MRTRRQPVYGNHLILHPDGTPMFRCAPRKWDFYVSRGLAKVEGERVARLTFEPNGRGQDGDEYHLAPKENQCVVCGSKKWKRLTIHHILPRCYRLHFPKHLTCHDWHDLVAICDPCHRRYTPIEDALKNRLADLYGVPRDGIMSTADIVATKAYGAAKAIVKHGHVIPAERITELRGRLVDYLGREPDDHELAILARKRFQSTVCHASHGELVAAKISDLQAFTVMWRRHFVETMQPQFMPDGWQPDRKLGPLVPQLH